MSNSWLALIAVALWGGAYGRYFAPELARLWRRWRGNASPLHLPPRSVNRPVMTPTAKPRPTSARSAAPRARPVPPPLSLPPPAVRPAASPSNVIPFPRRPRR